MSFAQRISHLKPEGAYAVLARAQALETEGREIIHLEIGQPDFPTPTNVARAGIKAIEDGKTGYNPPAGIPDLRRALAEDAGKRRGVEFSAAQVAVGPGGKPLLLLPMLALLEPGDEVIYPDPGFPSYPAAIGIAGAKAVPVRLLESQDFDLDLDALDSLISPKTRMIILNSPANPSGGVLSSEALTHIAGLALKNDIWVMSDEIYSRLTYRGDAPSIVSLPGMAERTILVDGFSKTYSMTGWRLGYGVMPEALATKIGLLLTHSVGCTATFTQFAGLEAITGPQDAVEAMRDEFRIRRDLIVMGLNDIPGMRCMVPQGAFYAFPNVKSFGKPAAELADYLLDEAGVALLPGTAFGKYGEGYLRLSYANSLENIQLALERIADALYSLQ